MKRQRKNTAPKIKKKAKGKENWEDGKRTELGAVLELQPAPFSEKAFQNRPLIIWMS